MYYKEILKELEAVKEEAETICTAEEKENFVLSRLLKLEEESGLLLDFESIYYSL